MACLYSCNMVRDLHARVHVHGQGTIEWGGQEELDESVRDWEASQIEAAAYGTPVNFRHST